MRKTMSVLVRASAFLTATAVSSTILLFSLTRPSLKVLHTWTQPDSISYDSFDPYHFSVVEGDLEWRGFPFSVSRRHFIYVGIEAGRPTYGHMIDFSFHQETMPLEEHLDRSSVLWTEEGVTFYEASGHELFIPREMFVGGR